MKLILWGAAITLALFGCTISTETQKVPAVISLTESHDEIQQLIIQLSGNQQVLLADSAFTKHSDLTVERKLHTTVNGQLLNGRVTEKPILFHLFIEDEQCFIENTGSGEQALLKVTECQIKSL